MTETNISNKYFYGHGYEKLCWFELPNTSFPDLSKTVQCGQSA